MRTQHTPTQDLKLPWRLELADSEIRIKTREHAIIHSEEWKDFPEYENAAISCAEFIVRACNSHDELVEALETLLDSLDVNNETARALETVLDSLTVSNKTERAWTEALTVLVKAKGDLQ